MANDDRMSAMDRVQQFSQEDPRVVQRPPATDVANRRGVRELDQPRGIRATPGGWHEKWLNPNTPVFGSILLEEELGFPCHSILVDNPTNQWVYIDGARRYIPPWTMGVVLTLPSGTQVGKVALQAPAQVTQAAVVNTFIWVGFTEEVLPPSGGFSLLQVGGGTPGASGLIGNVRLQDGASTNLAVVETVINDGSGYGSSSVDVNARLGLLSSGAGTFIRWRSANAVDMVAQSGLGAALVAPPGMWNVVSTPAANAAASASRAAGGAGVRHIGWRWKCTALVTTALAGPTAISAGLKDGASGGTVIDPADTVGFPNTGVGNSASAIGEPPLNLVGSVATAMTAEVNSAVTGLTQTATVNGYDAS